MALELFVPGRLCLFGEHTDWAGKYRTMNADIVPDASIVTGIEQGIYAEVEKSSIFEMYSEAPEIADIWQDFACRMSESELKNVAKSGSFFSYCAGVASYMLEWYQVGGVKITLKKMTLPMKSGLSSSAAICVLVARAFNKLYQLNLNTMGEMNIAYLGELRTSSRCGRLDQACAFGVKPNLMTFDGDEIEVRSLNVKKHLYWVFADLCAEKDTIKILSDLNKAYPFASTDEEKNLLVVVASVESTADGVVIPDGVLDVDVVDESAAGDVGDEGEALAEGDVGAPGDTCRGKGFLVEVEEELVVFVEGCIGVEFHSVLGEILVVHIVVADVGKDAEGVLAVVYLEHVGVEES